MSTSVPRTAKTLTPTQKPKCKKSSQIAKYCPSCGGALPTNQRCENCRPKKCSICGKIKKKEDEEPAPLPVELWISKDGKVKGFAKYRAEEMCTGERERMKFIELGMWGWFAGLIGKSG